MRGVLWAPVVVEDHLRRTPTPLLKMAASRPGL